MPGSAVRCMVPGCQPSSTKRHTLPKERTLREKWLQAIGLSELQLKSTNSNNRACADHFLPSDYGALGAQYGARLNKDAVPSQNLGPFLKRKSSTEEVIANKVLKPGEIPTSAGQQVTVVTELGVERIQIPSDECRSPSLSVPECMTGFGTIAWEPLAQTQSVPVQHEVTAGPPLDPHVVNYPDCPAEPDGQVE